MEDNDLKIRPKQPYFVMASSKYYKSVILKYGISHFYSFELTEGKDNAVLAIPDGCVDILFCCDESHPEARICGTVLSPSVVFNQSAAYYFGVRFLPGKVPDICNLPMSEIINQELPLDEVIQDKGLIEKITSIRDFKEQQKIFLDTYLHYYILSAGYNPKQNLREYLISQIVLSAGSLSIGELSTQTGYSERYINKVFKAYYGMTPKMFSKMMRFQYLLDNLNLNMEHVDFAELAQITGYYDQSHMMKDFKSFTKTTPRKYLLSLEHENYDDRLIVIKRGKKTGDSNET